MCVCVCWGAIIARYVFKEKRGRMKWCRDKICRVETNNCNQQLRQEAKIYKDKGPAQRWTRLPGTTTHIWHRNSGTTLTSLNWDIHGRKCQSGAQREKGSKIKTLLWKLSVGRKDFLLQNKVQSHSLWFQGSVFTTFMWHIMRTWQRILCFQAPGLRFRLFALNIIGGLMLINKDMLHN